MSLQETRKKAGLSQYQLSVKSGVNKRTIQNYEGGYRNINLANLYILTKLCNALNCELIDIITDEELLKHLKNM